MSSYIYTVLKLFRPFEGNREADVAPGENEFDTPSLEGIDLKKGRLLINADFSMR